MRACFERSSYIFALAFVMFFAGAVSAEIDKQLVVTVRTVCDSGGSNCASTGPASNTFFEAEADKIWAQAGIDIMFVVGANINSTFLNSSQNSVTDFTGPLGGTGTTMYLVNNLVCPSCRLFGQAYLGAGGLVINMDAVTSFNGGVGRLDTIAHEFGHNLGIGHTEANDNFLMHSGSTRNIPSSLSEICPSGPCYDLLPTDQISLARGSSLLVDVAAIPEPETYAMLLAGLGLLGVAARRRKQRAL